MINKKKEFILIHFSIIINQVNVKANINRIEKTDTEKFSLWRFVGDIGLHCVCLYVYAHVAIKMQKGIEYKIIGFFSFHFYVVYTIYI